MNVLTVTGHLVTDPVRRDTTRDVVREFCLASNPAIAQRAGES